MSSRLRPAIRVIAVGQQSFEFEVFDRELSLGQVSIQHYWMDVRPFRRRGGGRNFRPSVDLWRECLVQDGLGDDLEELVNWVWAETYPFVCESKALQDVYVDAYLHQSADWVSGTSFTPGVGTQRNLSVPAEDLDRVRRIVEKRDLAGVQTELERLFLGEMPSAAEQPAFDKAARNWLRGGVQAYRRGGREAMRRYLADELSPWIARLRRRGGQPQVHRFLNGFGHAAKTAFYHCYGTAWLQLIAEIRRTEGLSVPAERFLRAWHLPDLSATEANPRGAFAGQVLALHPLSAVFMSEPECLAAAGRWFSHPHFDQLQADGSLVREEAFWGYLRAILVAANEYTHARRRWNDSRHASRHISSLTDESAVASPEPLSIELFFDELAMRHGWRCAKCTKPVTYVSHCGGGPHESADVTFRCGACGSEALRSVSYDDVCEE